MLRQHYCLKISSKHSIPYTEERWSKYYLHIVFPKNMKAMVHSADRDTDFDIVTGVLQDDTLALYLFILCLDYVL